MQNGLYIYLFIYKRVGHIHEIGNIFCSWLEISQKFNKYMGICAGLDILRDEMLTSSLLLA
jgi:hypothetical protein